MGKGRDLYLEGMKIPKTRRGTNVGVSKRNADNLARRIIARTNKFKHSTGVQNPTRVGEVADVQINKFRKSSRMY